MPKKFIGVFEHIVYGGICGAGALIVFLMLAIVFEVVARYSGHPEVWTMEITEYALVYITFLGVAWVLKAGGHIRVDLITNRLNSKTQAVLSLASCIIGIAVSLVLVIYGSAITWDYFLTGRFQNTQLMLPSAPLYAAIPVGSLLLLVQFIKGAAHR